MFFYIFKIIPNISGKLFDLSVAILKNFSQQFLISNFYNFSKKRSKNPKNFKV